MDYNENMETEPAMKTETGRMDLNYLDENVDKLNGEGLALTSISDTYVVNFTHIIHTDYWLQTCSRTCDFISVYYYHFNTLFMYILSISCVSPRVINLLELSLSLHILYK